VSQPLPVIPSGPVSTVDEAVARMVEIAAVLPEADGLACFNRMYLTVTREVGARIGEGFFTDPPFMADLDVVFVNLYLGAVDAWVAGRGGVPRSWSVLLDRRDRTDVAPMQFALAGMNAHINRDLALAVVETCKGRRTSPAGGHRDDYERVNRLLGELEPGIRRSFETGVLLELDRRFAGLDDLMANFSVSTARDVAWSQACTLWRIRDERFLCDPWLDGLDRSVAFAGRLLLTPLPSA